MKKPIIITSVATILVVAFLAVGFSAFNSENSIEDMKVTVEPSILYEIAGITVQGADGATSTEEINDDSISLSIDLPENSTLNYQISITNIGNVELGILNIAGLPENLTYTLTDYQLGDRICEDDRCKLGITKTFNLAINYQPDGYNSDQTHYDFNLAFDFREAYKVEIAGYDNLEYQNHILDGANFEIALDSEPTSVLIDGNPCLTYTYLNGILTIPEVYGNISLAHS